MDWLRTLLETSPLTALFLTIAVGYLVGELNLKGFALGSGAVLFVGLACGAFAPKSAPPGMLGTLGLLLFLYCVGVQYGNEWFRGLTSPEGLKANFAAICGLTAAGLVSLAIYQAGAASLAEAIGLFAGSGTSTPTLQAAIDALQSQDPAVGYSVAYPFGVAGPILCMYLYLALFKPKLEAPAARRIQPTEVKVRNAALIGRPFPELQRSLPSGVQVVAIRGAQQNRVPTASTILDADDVVLVIGTDPAAIDKARTLIGQGTSGELTADRTDLDYVRVYASKRSIVGMPLGRLKIPGGFEYAYLQVRRGDTDLLPDDDLVLEFGDRVGVLCNRANFPAVRSFYGDSIKGTADFSYISIGVGASLGLIAGMIPLPVPGVGPDHAGAGRRPAGRARAGHAPPHVGDCVDAAVVGEPRAAQFRADRLPGAGRHLFGAQVRRDGGRDRAGIHPAGRPDPAAARGGHHDRGTAAGHPRRRSLRHRVRCDRQPGHSGLREPRRPDRSAGHRVRDDLSVDDGCEDPVRADRRGATGRVGDVVRFAPPTTARLF